jgi:hypothetical protein
MALAGLWVSLKKSIPSGLKPALFFATLMYGLKPVPFKLTHNRLSHPAFIRFKCAKRV